MLPKLYNFKPLYAGDTSPAIQFKIKRKENETVTPINIDDSTLVGKIEAIGSPLQNIDYVEPDNASIGQILSKVETLENTELTGIATTNDVANSKTEILTAISGIPETDISTLALESTSQSIKNKVDNLPTMEELEATQILALKSDLIIINENVIDSSLLIPAIKKIL